MKKTIFSVALVGIMGLVFASCQKDAPEAMKKSEIKNPALAAVLKAKGYTLEGNMLRMNEKAMNTTALDLSGTKLTDVSGLEVFPKLEEVNLADNGLGPAFDFAPLPGTIKRINLAGNEIYDYLNLAATDYEKGEYNLIRSLDKLTLPATAKYNMDALPAFMKTAPQCDMQMQNKEGKAEKYTTLREVPDEILLTTLKETFPEIFAENKIDISKQLIKSDNNPLLLEPFLGIKSLEGVEYVLNNPLYRGTIMIEQAKENPATLPYLKPGNKLERLWFSYVNTPIIDLQNAKNLHILALKHNQKIETVDLRKTSILQRGEKGYNADNPDMLILADSPKLTELKMPETKSATLYTLQLIALPLLKTPFNMGSYDIMQEIALAQLPLCTLTMPTPKHWLASGGIDDKNGTISFNITEDIYKKTEVTAFVKKYNPLKKLSSYRKTYFKRMGFTFLSFNWTEVAIPKTSSTRFLLNNQADNEQLYDTSRKIMLRIIENEKPR